MWVLIASLIVAEVGATAKLDNLVAFQSDHPAVFQDRSGKWNTDYSVGLLTSPVDVLNFCTKKFKSQDVTNVVELRATVKVPDWCKLSENGDNCEIIEVRPWRCLVGPFTSDALLVPSACDFDHIHNTSRCARPERWWKQAEDKCSRRNMALSRQSMLLPCGVDKYYGVEFVCCPAEYDSKHPKKNKHAKSHNKHKDLKDDLDDDDDDVKDKEDVDWMKQERFQDDNDDIADAIVGKHKTVKKAGPKKSLGSYEDYMNEKSEKNNEHEMFLAAKGQLKQIQHQKVTKIMKEWSEARTRVQDVKAKDPLAAEKLGRDIAIRFQTEYSALEDLDKAERHQLSELHQKRVQSALNDKKRKAMDKLTNLIRKYGASDREENSIFKKKSRAVVLKNEEDHLAKALENYIRSEERDRQHSINHWSHLLDQEPNVAVVQEPLIRTHLDLINRRMSQSLDLMHGRINDKGVVQRARARAQRFVKSFADLDEDENALIRETEEEKRRQIKQNGGGAKDEKTNDVADNEVKPAVVKDDINKKEGGDMHVEIKTWTEHVSRDPTTTKATTTTTTTTAATADPSPAPGNCGRFTFNCHEQKESLSCVPRAWVCDGDLDCAHGEDERDCGKSKTESPDEMDGMSANSESAEEEHGEEKEEDEGDNEHFAHALDNTLHVNEPIWMNGRRGSVRAKSDDKPDRKWFIVFGCLGAVVLVAGLVVVKRHRSKTVARKQRLAAAHTAARLMDDGEQISSPEERHVNNMQVNGYENPTYRYLEVSTK